MVFVDQAAESLSETYRGDHGDHDGRDALMRAVIVEVVHVPADHREGVSFVVDQQPGGAFLTQARPHRSM